MSTPDEGGFQIARAFVAVEPDAADFQAQLDEQVGSPVVRVTLVPVAPDFDAQVQEEAGSPVVTVTVEADTSPAQAELADLEGGIPRSASFTVDADVAPAEAQLSGLDAKLAALEETFAELSVGANTGAAGGDLEALSAQLDELEGKRSEIVLGANTGDTAEQLSQLNDDADVLQGTLQRLAEQSAVTGSALGAVGGGLGVIDAASGATVGALAGVESALDGVHSGADTAAAGLDSLEGALGTAGAAMADTEAEAAGLGSALTVDLNNAAGMYDQVAAALENVAGSAGAAREPLTATAADVDALSEAFAGLSMELHQVDVATAGEIDTVGELQAQMGGMAGELDAAATAGGMTATAFESLQMRLQATGVAVDMLTAEIPVAVAELEALGGSVYSSSVASAVAAYDEAAGGITAMGTAAAGAAGEMGVLDGEVAALDAEKLGEFLSFGGMLSPELLVVGAMAAAVGGLGYALLHFGNDTQNVVGQLAKQDDAVGYNITGFQKLSEQLSGASGAAVAMRVNISENTSTFSEAHDGLDGYADAITQVNGAQQKAASEALNLSGHLGTLESEFGLTQAQAEQLATAAGVTAKQLAGGGDASQEAMLKIEAYANANLGARGPVTELSTDMEIFGNDTLTAATRVDALNQAYDTLVGNFVSTQQAQLQVASDFLTFASNATIAGASMTGTNAASVQLQQSFYAVIPGIEATADAMLKQGDSAQQVNTYIDDQITKLSGLAGGSQGAATAVQDLRTWEDNLRDSTSQASTQFHQAATIIENEFTKSVTDSGVQSGIARTAVGFLATAVLDTGSNSSATAAARAQLIADLEAAGVNASTARQDVSNFITELGKIPGNTPAKITVTGSGQWSVSEQSVSAPGTAGGGKIFINQNAAGGLVTGGSPGEDSVLSLLTPGELVVPESMVKAGAVDHLRGRLPRFASGGLVGVSGSLASGSPGAGGAWADSEYNSTGNAIVLSVEQAMATAINADVAAAKAKAAAGGGTPGAAGPGGGTPAANAALAQSMMPAWASGPEWQAWDAVAMRESGWSNTALNASSGAYGIPQALPASKMGAAANPPQSNARAQISWMISYIQGRYKDPIGAEAHEVSAGWYDQGGYLQPGLTLAMNNTGRPERVVAPGQESGGPAQAVHYHNSFNYYGPQVPTPEMKQAMLLDLATAVGAAG